MTKLWNSLPLRYIRACVTLYFDKQVPRSAASLAYFLLLTLFPLLICVNAFLAILQLDSRQILEIVEGFLPEVSLGTIELYLSYISANSSRGLLLAGLIAVFTMASAAFRTLMKALADIYETPPRRGLRSILISILFPLGLLLTIYLSIGVIVTGEWLSGFLGQYVSLEHFLGLWQSLRFWLLFFVFFLFILIMSRLALPRGVAQMPVFIGSALSASALVAASALFSLFVSLSARYSLIYGSLLSIVAMMLWLYLCGTILLSGNIVSSVWYRMHGAARYALDSE